MKSKEERQAGEGGGFIEKYVEPINEASADLNAASQSLVLLPDVGSWLNRNGMPALELTQIGEEHLQTFVPELESSLTDAHQSLANVSKFARELLSPDVARQIIDDPNLPLWILAALDTTQDYSQDPDAAARIQNIRVRLGIIDESGWVEPTATVLAGSVGREIRNTWGFFASIAGLGAKGMREAEEEMLRLSNTGQGFAEGVIEDLWLRGQKHEERQADIETLLASLEKKRPVSVDGFVRGALENLETLNKLEGKLTDYSGEVVDLVRTAAQMVSDLYAGTMLRKIDIKAVENRAVFSALLLQKASIGMMVAATMLPVLISARIQEMYNDQLNRLDAAVGVKMGEDPTEAIINWASQTKQLRGGDDSVIEGQVRE